MLAICHLTGVEHGAAGQPGLEQFKRESDTIDLGELLNNDLVEFIAVLEAVAIGGKARILRQLGPVQHLADLLEGAVVARAKHHRHGLGLVHAVRHQGRVLIARQRRHFARQEVVREMRVHQRQAESYSVTSMAWPSPDVDRS